MAERSAAATSLSQFLGEERERIVKSWLKLLRDEPLPEMSAEHRRARLPEELTELARLLRDRPEDAARLWAEVVRPRGAARFEARYGAPQLVLEFHLLHNAIEEVWRRHTGKPLSGNEGLLMKQCILDAERAALSSHQARARRERVEFREAALMETILHHLDEGVALVEVDGALSYVTPMMEQVTGVDWSPFLGRSWKDTASELMERLGAKSLEGRPLRYEDLPSAKVLVTGRPVEPLLINLSKPGVEGGIVVEMGTVPILEESGRLRGLILTYRDRTEETRRAQELRSAYQALSEMHERLMRRTRLQAMGEIAAGAAHALNNLLNAMHLRLARVKERPSAQELAALDHSIADVAQLVQRLQSLAARRTVGPPEAVDLNASIREALDLVRPDLLGLAEGRPLRVETVLSEVPRVWANPVELREVLVTLLLRARDVMPMGGTVRVRSFRGNSGATVSVEDEGPSSPDLAAQIFAPFVPTEPTVLTFGLRASREAFQQWGGELVARSKGERGTEFTLHLRAAERAVPEARVPERVLTVGGRKILVVDDDPDNARILAELLGDAGHSADSASTGEEALQMFRTGAYQVALVDLLMPDISGWEIARRMRELKPEARLAIVTGWEVSAEERAASPVDGVFRKPLDLDQLLRFVQESAAAPMELS